MVVLGQVATGVGIDASRPGIEMELVLDTLYEDDDERVPHLEVEARR